MGQTSSKRNKKKKKKSKNEPEEEEEEPEPEPEPLPRYSVSIGNWSKYVKNHINNNINSDIIRFIIGKHGGGTIDPAIGCNKDFDATYKCGYGLTKSVSVNANAHGKFALFTCLNENNLCNSYRLKLTNTGNIILTYNNKTIWQSNTSKVGIPTDKYKASNSKYKRDYIKPGEYLEENEFIGSSSGNCYILMTKNGLDLCYENLDCKINDNLIGYGTSKNSYTLYELPSVNENNINKVGYLSYDAQLVESIKEGFTNQNINYFDLGNYNSTDKSLTLQPTYSNYSNEQCKEMCNKYNECGGYFISTKTGKCELKKSNIKLNSFRKEDNDGNLYIKSEIIPENSTFNNKITNILGVEWDKLIINNKSKINKLTELGLITEEEKNVLINSENKLIKSNNSLKNAINNLTIEEAEISENTKNDIMKFRNNLNNYQSTYDKTQELKSKIDNLHAMKKDSELQLIMDSKHYLLWSIVTILVVIGGMKIIKAN